MTDVAEVNTNGNYPHTELAKVDPLATAESSTEHAKEDTNQATSNRQTNTNEQTAQDEVSRASEAANVKRKSILADVKRRLSVVIPKPDLSGHTVSANSHEPKAAEGAPNVDQPQVDVAQVDSSAAHLSKDTAQAVTPRRTSSTVAASIRRFSAQVTSRVTSTTSCRTANDVQGKEQDKVAVVVASEADATVTKTEEAQPEQARPQSQSNPSKSWLVPLLAKAEDFFANARKRLSESDQANGFKLQHPSGTASSPQLSTLPRSPNGAGDEATTDVDAQASSAVAAKDDSKVVAESDKKRKATPGVKRRSTIVQHVKQAFNEPLFSRNEAVPAVPPIPDEFKMENTAAPVLVLNESNAGGDTALKSIAQQTDAEANANDKAAANDAATTANKDEAATTASKKTQLTRLVTKIKREIGEVRIKKANAHAEQHSADVSNITASPDATTTTVAATTTEAIETDQAATATVTATATEVVPQVSVTDTKGNTDAPVTDDDATKAETTQHDDGNGDVSNVADATDAQVADGNATAHKDEDKKAEDGAAAEVKA